MNPPISASEVPLAMEMHPSLLIVLDPERFNVRSLSVCVVCTPSGERQLSTSSLLSLLSGWKGWFGAGGWIAGGFVYPW